MNEKQWRKSRRCVVRTRRASRRTSGGGEDDAGREGCHHLRVLEQQGIVKDDLGNRLTQRRDTQGNDQMSLWRGSPARSGRGLEDGIEAMHTFVRVDLRWWGRRIALARVDARKS